MAVDAFELPSLENMVRLKPAAHTLSARALTPPGLQHVEAPSLEYASHSFVSGNDLSLRIVLLGLWPASFPGNTHAPTHSAVFHELAARGHDVLFLERGQPMVLPNRHLPQPADQRVEFYSDLHELKDRFTREVRNADFVMAGSGVAEGIAIGEWINRIAHGATAFYDLDTQATIARLIRGGVDWVSPALIRRYHIYLSTSGGPILDYIEKHYGSPMARPLYPAIDPALYFPEERPHKWDLGFLGRYRPERQPALERMLIEPARRWSEGRFVVAGAEYPRTLRWPKNVKRDSHVSPGKHRAFYNSQRFTLNLTRPNTIAAAYSPGIRLFETAACATPVITNEWEGLDAFFSPDEEILVSHSGDETLVYLEEISEAERRRIAAAARDRVLNRHTSRQRALELELYATDVLKRSIP